MNNFEDELRALILKYATIPIEHPDSILVDFIGSCLTTYTMATKDYREWYKAGVDTEKPE